MVSIDVTTYDNDDQLVNIWADDDHYVIILTDEDGRFGPLISVL